MEAATASIRSGGVRRRLLDDYRPVAPGAARAWVDFFTMLRSKGRAGVFVNGFLRSDLVHLLSHSTMLDRLACRPHHFRLGKSAQRFRKLRRTANRTPGFMASFARTSVALQSRRNICTLSERAALVHRAVASAECLISERSKPRSASPDEPAASKPRWENPAFARCNLFFLLVVPTDCIRFGPAAVNYEKRRNLTPRGTITALFYLWYLWVRRGSCSPSPLARSSSAPERTPARRERHGACLKSGAMPGPTRESADGEPRLSGQQRTRLTVSTIGRGSTASSPIPSLTTSKSGFP